MAGEAAANSGLDLVDDEEHAMAYFADAVEAGTSAAAALRQAVARFPAHAMLLADYAAHLQVLSGEVGQNAIGLETLVEEIAAAKMDLRLSEWNGIPARLKELARSPVDVCRRLRVGRSVITKLDRRMIDVASIPGAFLEALCGELQTTRDALTVFLSTGPRLSAVAEYRSKTVPGAGRKESFQCAIEASVGAGEINPATAGFWLAEKRDPI